MRIAQYLLPHASEYEQKCMRADRAALEAKSGAEIVGVDESPDLVHVYGTPTKDLGPLRLRAPYVTAAEPPKPRFSFRRPAPPAAIVSPLGDRPVPEVVEERYFQETTRRLASDVKTVGSFAREATRNQVEQTLSRLQRFRSDITWDAYSRVPSPEDLASVDLWVDPTSDPADFDGFVAEALVVGTAVVAARTPINALRLEQGRTGMLVPPSDPNEMTHAILAALFKAEVAESRQIAARQTVSKFRARHRLRILWPLYESLTS